MDFYKVVDDVLELLRGRGRVTYRALKVQFQLDDEQLEALKEEVIYAKRLALDEDNRILVWVGEPVTTPPTPTPPTPEPTSPSTTQHEREPLTYTPRHLAEKILTSRSALEGERKQVTVLFCDLATSTAIAEKIGPEAMHTLLNRFFELALNEIHRYEGTINQFLGDGFMALFGAPIAHEDHARRGVLAALGLQRRLTEANLGKPYGVECAFRMGLNSGLVVVGSIGDNLRMDYSAIGDTTNLASRLQGIAEPGDILINETTARLVQGYMRLEALAPVEVRGKTEPVSIYKVIGTLPRRSPIISRSERTLSQFVGRERELAVLDELFHQVESGQGQVVGIVAEAGGGKSRLLYEFRQRLQDKRVTYLEGRCLSYGQTIPYHPLIDILRHNCGIGETDSPEAIHEKVCDALQEIGMDAGEAAPYLLQLLGMRERTESISQLTPEAIRNQTFDTLKQMSLKGSQQRPLIFEIEDLHWIDNTSQDYLASLVENVAGASIMLLTTYRPGYQPSWLGKSYATQISLHNLAPHDGLTVVHSALHGETLSEQLEQIILAKAEGNPFFLEELTRVVLEYGDTETDIDVPDTIQGVLSARIDRLPEEHKRLLQTAAILGREFSRSLLQAIWEGPETLDSFLQDLKRREFLYERTGAEEPLYVFKHGLTQEVTYASLLQGRRRALHTQTVAALEGLTHDRLAVPVAQLAYHAFRGEMWDKAVTYFRQASTQATSRSAYREAVTCLEQALIALEHLPESHQTLERAFELRMELRQGLVPLANYAKVLDTLRQAEAIAEALGDRRRLCLVYAHMIDYCRLIGNNEQAMAYGERAFAMMTALEDVSLTALVTYRLGIACYPVGDYRRAAQLLEQSVTILSGELSRKRLGTSGVTAVFARSYSVFPLLELGEFVVAQTVGKEALSIASDTDTAHGQLFAAHAVGMAYLYQGEFDHAIPLLEQTLQRAQVERINLDARVTASTLGYAYVLFGRVTDGIRLLEQGVQQSETLHIFFRYALCLSWLGEAYLRANHVDAAFKIANRAITHARTRREPGHQAYALRLLGEIVAHHEPRNIEQAEAHYHQALTLAEAMMMRPLQAHCHCGLGTLYSQTGQREQARDALSTAIKFYQEMAMTFWLVQAKATLSQVEARS